MIFGVLLIVILVLDGIGETLRAFWAVVRTAFVGRGDPAVKAAFLEACGEDPSRADELEGPVVSSEVIDRIDTALGGREDSLIDKARVIDDLIEVVRAIELWVRAMRVAPAHGPDLMLVDAPLGVLSHLLAMSAVEARHPRLGPIARILGVLGDELSARYAEVTLYRRIEAAAEDLASNWKENGGARTKTFVAAAAMAGLGLLLKAAGIVRDYRVGWGWDLPEPAEGDEEEAPEPSRADQISARTASLVLLLPILPPGERGEPVGGLAEHQQTDADRRGDEDPGAAETTARVATSIVVVPEEDGGPSVGVLLQGGVDVPFDLGPEWRLRAAVDLPLPESFYLAGEPGPARSPGATVGGGVRLALERRPEAPPTAVGAAPGTRLELGPAAVSFELGFDNVGARLLARDSTLVLAAEGDRWWSRAVKKIFGEGEELRLKFDLGLGWDLRRGLYLEGGSGLSVTIPVSFPLGPARVSQLALALVEEPSDTGPSDVRLTVAANVRVDVVLARVTVDQVGLDLGFEWDGPVPRRLAALAFKAPDGLGVELGWGCVRGTAYLFRDPTTGHYAGVGSFHLTRRLRLDVLALVSTRTPDGRDASSTFLAGALAFLTQPVGLGWNLKRVGLIVAIDRTFDVDAARARLRTGALEFLPALADPLASAPELFATIDALFPAREDERVLALTAQFAWGARDLVVVDVAAMFDTTYPDRLVLLGALRVRIPHPERAVVRLNLDAIGTWDFGIGEIRLDASLYDSRVSHLTVSGDAAVFVRYEKPKSLVIAAGGFHPGFTEPVAGQFDLQRLRISMPGNDFVRLDAEGYFAVAAGSIQVGARVDVFVGVRGVLGIEGTFAFDALIAFAPCGLDLRLDIRVALVRGDSTLLGARFRGALAGPNPWKIEGTVEIRLLWWSLKKSVSRTFGGGESVTMGALDAGARLRAALVDPRSWSGEGADGGALQPVSIRDGAATAVQFAVAIDPLQGLAVRQQEVPLGVRLDHVGGAPIQGAREFLVDGVEVVGAGDIEVVPVTEDFAPGLYFALDDAAKLTRASFEPMTAGVAIAARQARAGAPLGLDLAFEDIELDGEGVAPPAGAPPRRYVPRAEVFSVLVGAPRAPARSAPDRFAGPARAVVLA